MKPSFDLPDLDEIIDMLKFSNKFINWLILQAMISEFYSYFINIWVNRESRLKIIVLLFEIKEYFELI